jgi:hypothetical protein
MPSGANILLRSTLFLFVVDDSNRPENKIPILGNRLTITPFEIQYYGPIKEYNFKQRLAYGRP